MNNMNKGFFLVIEGLDGSGKTEISRRLVEILEDAHPQDGSVKLTFEPHDPSCGGLFIRQVLMRKRHHDPHTLALAFAANRADHLVRDIIPFLEKDSNHIVVCDRYYLSSLVYQTTSNISIDEIMAFNAGAIPPDLIIFLNASDSTCFQRMRARSENKELFETNLRKTRDKYLRAIDYLRQRGDTIVEVNADGTRSEVLNNILGVLMMYAPEWLRSQLLLPMDLTTDASSDVISINGTPQFTFVNLAEEVVSSMKIGSSLSELMLHQIKTRLEQEILYMPNGKIGALFIDYLRLFRYRILGEIPWSETKALDLEYSMPLDIQQRGIALFLNKQQSYALITKKILDLDTWDLDPHVLMLSNFVICLDFSNEQVALKYFDQDLIIKKEHTSPAVILLTRSHILDMALSMVLAILTDEYLLSMSALPDLKQLIFNAIHKWELNLCWSVATNVIRQGSKINEEVVVMPNASNFSEAQDISPEEDELSDASVNSDQPSLIS